MIEMVATLEFGRGGNAEQYLGAGWSVGEDGHRWMTGQHSELWLECCDPDCDCLLELEVHPYVYPPAVPGQQLVIAIGAVHLSEIEVRRPATLGFLLPAALLATQGRTLVTLIHQNAARPIDVGSGGDDLSRCP
jgi:hypothetical protein